MLRKRMGWWEGLVTHLISSTSRTSLNASSTTEGEEAIVVVVVFAFDFIF